MWTVRPEEVDEQRVTSIIALSSISRACHLMPVCRTTRIPFKFRFSSTLDAFRRFFVNVYADYHSHELLK